MYAELPVVGFICLGRMCSWLFPAGNMQALLNNSGSILPALRYGMNVQLMAGQPQIPPEAAFRILTTCSWEQNAYTVKIYVPLHGVKTDLLRAVFQPNTIDIKTMNLQVHVLLLHMMIAACNFMPSLVLDYGMQLATIVGIWLQNLHLFCGMQGKNYIFSIKQTHWPINPDGCSVVASKTKKNILITIAVRSLKVQQACPELNSVTGEEIGSVGGDDSFMLPVYVCCFGF